MTEQALIAAWRSIVDSPEKSWVLFEQGTCVILMDPQGDLAAQATQLLREWGPVRAGTFFGDFDIIELEEDQGWVVTCHHEDILTYVAPEERNLSTKPVEVGLYGRAKRGQDAETLRVIHVEDKRPQ